MGDEHHRNASGTVVLIRHRVAVRTGDRNRQKIADNRMLKRDRVDQLITGFAMPSNHADQLTAANAVNQRGLEPLTVQGHLKVVSHTAIDSDMGNRTWFDRGNPIDGAGRRRRH